MGGLAVNEDVRSLKLGGHVGFDSLPDQLVNKSLQNGFCFNILSIGIALNLSSVVRGS